MNRRHFLTTAVAGGAAVALPASIARAQSRDRAAIYAQMDEAARRPVLKTGLFREPVIITAVELLRHKGNFLCRVRAKNGAEGVSFANSRMDALYPIVTELVAPFFVGKDAVQLDSLLDEVYLYEGNYKLQSVALWIPVATVEFAILDLLGRIAGKPMGELIGEIHHPTVELYQANSERGISPEVTMEHLLKQLEKSQARAVKFKVGGRMSAPEIPEKRSERLIPLMRKTLGDDMVIFADANGSYDVAEAIRIGRIMEEHKFDFFEEPVPYDWYEETKVVADALCVPVAGGEQEGSMRNFRWLLGNDALQVLQADMFYFGGMIRSMRAARMAEVLGIPHTPHVSNIGYVYMLHFVSALPNAGRFHEFKSPFNDGMEFECPTSTLLPAKGVVQVPTGPGLGINFAPAFIARHEVVGV